MFKESGGNPWQSQWGFNPSVQNDITDWKKVSSLVYPTSSAATLVTKNYIYVLGGFNANIIANTIQRASFDANGNLTSTWSNVGFIPEGMRGMGYVATKGRFYLIGGADHLDALSSVYSATINPDGTLGVFRQETSLPTARCYHVCFVIKDKLYVVGGGDKGYINTVHRATINSNGTLNSWETLPDFPISFIHGTPLIIKDKIYIFGVNDNVNYESKIYYATYDSNGNIGAWTYISNMPNNITNSAIVCTDNYVFSIGGYDENNSQYTNAAYRTFILADGSIGDWVQIGDAPIATGHAQVAIAGNKIYFIGGWNNGVNLDTVYSATFNSGITDYTPFYTD
jgi:N-acetylneuraminic acid mutarotase